VAGPEIVQLASTGALRGPVRQLAGYAERGAPLRRREVPFAGAVIVLSLGPDMWIDGGWTGSFVAGLYDRPVITGHGGEQAGLQLDVSPLDARRLLGVPMDELYNRTVALEDVLPRARELTERVAEAPTWAARRAVVEAWVAAAPERPPAPPQVRRAYARLVHSAGAVRVEDLARETGWSRRHLTERFRREVGMTPKAFARLLRFERAVGLLRAGESTATAAYAAGYADQPHMNRDFRQFLGAPPGHLPSVQDPLPDSWHAAVP
jgi:AraC-like DNA-binding protein